MYSPGAGCLTLMRRVLLMPCEGRRWRKCQAAACTYTLVTSLVTDYSAEVAGGNAV